MLGILFLKECKQMLRCLTYYIIVICMLLMYTTQLGNEGVISKPQPGQKEYGYIMSGDESVIMNSTIIILAREYEYNSYGTYPIAFYKEVKLNKAKQEEVGDILSEVTGIDREKLDTCIKDYFSDKYFINSGGQEIPSDTASEEEPEASSAENKKLTLAVKEGISYEYFTELMAKTDKLLGGGSSYAKDNLQHNAYVPMTYEQALAEYNDIIEKDHLTGAYARVFCDYLGIVLAILPIFIAVTRGLRDRRARAQEIIFSRKASSFHIVMSRFLAMVAMLLLPVLLLAVIMSLDCINIGLKEGIAVDYLAFPRYILGWLLPTIMITTSVGVFLTELTDTAIAIIVQGFWWFISVLSGKLTGDSGFNLIPRHNYTGYYDIFQEHFGQFVINRLFYAAVSLIILFASIYLYEMKRKGRLNIRGKIFSNRKIQSEA